MIKASLILAIAYGACALLRKRPAAERHLVWALSLPAAAMLPLLELLVPEWRPEWIGRVVAAALPAARPAASGIGETAAGAIVHAVGIEPAGSFAWLVVTLWAPGFLIASLLLLSGARAFRFLAAGSHSLADPACVKIVAALRRAYGIERSPILMQSRGTTLPVTWGVFHPRVLLPGGAAEWPEARKFAVLAHELAHIRRLDWIVQILAEVCCALYWFHPFFWFARNRLLLESERACDDAALRQGIEERDYAQHLLDIARALRQAGAAWSLAMARPAHLEKRLIAILNPATKREALSRRPAVAVVLCLVCLVAPLAAMRGPDLESNGPREAVAGSAASAHVIKYTTPPLYSDEALGLKIEGVVTVEATVGREGRATNLRVLNGLGFGLDENALLAVRDWQFAPALHNGKAVVSTTQVDVEFSLLNAELNDMIANDMATRVGPDVEPPRIVHRVEPRYPWLFSEARQGSVLLDVVIQEDGIPRVVRVLRSLTWQFDEAAIAALEQWRFSPASLGGSRVKVRMNVEIPFVPLQN